MKEAFRLLNKSIIRVETPDINLDQEDEMEEEEQQQEGSNTQYLRSVRSLNANSNTHSSWQETPSLMALTVSTATSMGTLRVLTGMLTV